MQRNRKIAAWHIMKAARNQAKSGVAAKTAKWRSVKAAKQRKRVAK